VAKFLLFLSLSVSVFFLSHFHCLWILLLERAFLFAQVLAERDMRNTLGR
jgi:hypothetical protein